MEKYTDQDECDDDMTRTEEHGETHENESESEDEAEHLLGNVPFSPLASEHTGDPPQHFDFNLNEHSGSPHLPGRPNTNPRDRPGQ